MRWKWVKVSLSLCCLLGIMGCGSRREPIKSAVSSALTGIQNFDEVTVEKYFSENLLLLDNILDLERVNELLLDEMMPQLVERFSFRIIDSKQEGDRAVVKTELINANMKEVISLYVIELARDSFSEADILGSGELSDKELLEKYRRMMTCIVHDTSIETINQIVDIELVYEDNGWRIIVTEALLDGVYGGLISLFK